MTLEKIGFPRVDDHASSELEFGYFNYRIHVRYKDGSGHRDATWYPLKAIG